MLIFSLLRIGNSVIFSITIEDRPTTNQIPSISLKTPFSVAKEETTKGWRGPSGTLEGVYIDGAPYIERFNIRIRRFRGSLRICNHTGRFCLLFHTRRSTNRPWELYSILRRGFHKRKICILENNLHPLSL